MFNLALSLGKTVEEIETTMTQREFSEWVRYAGYEPWGETRSDLRVGLQTLAVARVAGNKNAKLDDFVLDVHKGQVPVASTKEDIVKINRENACALAHVFPSIFTGR